MSFPRDIDEIDEELLKAELQRRQALRAKGLCDYCERAPSKVACKFPDRHRKVDAS